MVRAAVAAAVVVLVVAVAQYVVDPFDAAALGAVLVVGAGVWLGVRERRRSGGPTPGERAARRARRPVTVWMWVVIVGAVATSVPALLAEQDFGRFIPGTSTCEPEPWPIRTGWLRVFAGGWIGLVLLAVIGVVVFLRDGAACAEDPKRERMVWAGLVVALAVPPVLWGALYVMATANCGL